MSRREATPARAVVFAFALMLGVVGCSNADVPELPSKPPPTSGSAVPNLDLPAEVDPSVVVGADG